MPSQLSPGPPALSEKEGVNTLTLLRGLAQMTSEKVSPSDVQHNSILTSIFSLGRLI